jgi:hypothetical protein
MAKAERCRATLSNHSHMWLTRENPLLFDISQHRIRAESPDVKNSKGASLLGGEKPSLIHDLIAGIDDNVLVCARLLSKVITATHDDKLRPFGVSSAQFILLAAIR